MTWHYFAGVLTGLALVGLWKLVQLFVDAHAPLFEEMQREYRRSAKRQRRRTRGR